ncbi:hypothetical protein ElyMa_004395200 [Elysia marginata]|uniref:Uncharacterized protein n=1 Tax=Elysia marginata TaxID=1093978 RepID=A0AAV4H9N6_9GAST|nr:hypothetical protein ElyMa_004395200 [Elysia marginata]
MASKLYPTLSTFYKAGNVGFGSEHDAMLCGVPEEKLYRKPSKQIKEMISQDLSRLEQSRPSVQNNDGQELTDASKGPQLPETVQAQSEEDPVSPPLIPSAPPLLEMLDLRLQQYLNMILSPCDISNEGPVLPREDYESAPSDSPSDSDLPAGTCPTTVTLPLPPNVVVEDAWLDEIRPDYDDLTPEEMADEILNNLNVVREEDSKDHEKQKSLSLLRTPKESEAGKSNEGEERHRQQPYHYQHRDHRQRHNHSYQQQSSQSSREDNADIDDTHRHHQHQERQRNHRQRQQDIDHRHKAHGAVRLQERASLSRDDLRHVDRLKRHESAEKLSSGTSHETSGSDRRLEAVYPHRRSQHHHTNRGRHESRQSASKFVGGRRESGKSSSRRLSSGAEKENQHGSPGRAEAHAENSDYNAWMTWRKQVNRQLATIILLKQQGKNVAVQTTDMRRKPLRQSSIDFVSQIATQSGSTTSLGGKPYVMYGIPRASLLSKSEISECKNES